MSIKVFIPVIVLVMTVLHSVQADEKRHRQLAEEYLELAGYKKQLNATNEISAEAFVGTTPGFKNDQAAIERAFGRVFSWDKIKPELVREFTKYFTEDELIELISFCKTPVGKKLNVKSPEITKTYHRLSLKLAGENGDALTKAIQEEIAKDKK